MIRFLDVIGARPQIIKAAAVSRVIKNFYSGEITDIILHTGQHYDSNMSEIFIRELGVSYPKYNLNIGSGTHARQTASIIIGVEEIIGKEKPDYVLTYGDTNSTLAAALAAAKLHVPVVHIEAGMRSFDKLMPEEINRIMCDHVSTLLFTPTQTGYNNLINEGFRSDNRPPYSINNPGIFHCGDIMYDNYIYYSQISKASGTIIQDLDLIPGNFILLTIHRPANTDNIDRLKSILKVVNDIAADYKITFIVPLHPRTSKLIRKNLEPELFTILSVNKYIRFLEPLSFLEMMELEKETKMIFTDSGGVQKEAYFFKKPCIILRKETEWTELVKSGNAILTDVSYNTIWDAYEYFLRNKDLNFIPLFGNGHAAEFICSKILGNNAG